MSSSLGMVGLGDCVGATVDDPVGGDTNFYAGFVLGEHFWEDIYSAKSEMRQRKGRGTG